MGDPSCRDARPTVPVTGRRDPGQSGHRLAPDLLGAACLGLLLAVVMSWPLALHLGSDIGHDTGDPLLQTWQIAWIGHAWLHQPLHVFQANTYWPFPDSLAFSDAPIGYSPAGLLAQHSPHAAILVYNLLFIFAYALAFFGAYVLVLELGLGRIGGVVAGAAYAYAPWRLAQGGHLHVLSSGGIPLALALLIHGYRRTSARFVVAGWLVAGWQITLGFTLGLQFATLLVALSAIAFVTSLRRMRRRLDRQLLIATAVGIGVFCLLAFMQARPYFRVVDAHPEARRSFVDVFRFSPPLAGFLAAPEESFVWGRATSHARAMLPFAPEQTLFPGVTISLLAVVGLLGGVFSRRLRLGLAIGVAACALLSLGVRDSSFDYLTPYRLLYEFVPGWDGIRTPGRLNTLTSLGLAVLAANGATSILGFVRRRFAQTHRSCSLKAPHVVGAVLVIAVLLEGFGTIAHPRVPPIPPGQRSAVAPVLHLPSDFLHDSLYMYWSTAGFTAMANGVAGFDPSALVRLREEVREFPDAVSVAALRRFGIHTVVLHPGLAAGTPWSGSALRPVDGLSLERDIDGGVILYRLEPLGRAERQHGSTSPQPVLHTDAVSK